MGVLRFSSRYLAGYGNSRLELHGRPLARTWTLLAETAGPGDTSLTLNHLPGEMGWRVGDRVGLATTSRSNSTTHTITAILGTTVEVEPAVQFEHWGGWRTIEGLRFEMAAEVRETPPPPCRW